MTKKTLLPNISLLLLLSAGVQAETLSVSDALLDFEALVGEKVTVKGFALKMGDMGFLYEERGSMTALMLDDTGASRDARKYLLKSCSAGCNATITGTLSNAMFGKTLVVESIE